MANCQEWIYETYETRTLKTLNGALQDPMFHEPFKTLNEALQGPTKTMMDLAIIVKPRGPDQGPDMTDQETLT